MTKSTKDIKKEDDIVITIESKKETKVKTPVKVKTEKKPKVVKKAIIKKKEVVKIKPSVSTQTPEVSPQPVVVNNIINADVKDHIIDAKIETNITLNKKVSKPIIIPESINMGDPNSKLTKPSVVNKPIYTKPSKLTPIPLPPSPSPKLTPVPVIPEIKAPTIIKVKGAPIFTEEHILPPSKITPIRTPLSVIAQRKENEFKSRHTTLRDSLEGVYINLGLLNRDDKCDKIKLSNECNIYMNNIMQLIDGIDTCIGGPGAKRGRADNRQRLITHLNKCYTGKQTRSSKK